jgi:hypothetical protein
MAYLVLYTLAIYNFLIRINKKILYFSFIIFVVIALIGLQTFLIISPLVLLFLGLLPTLPFIVILINNNLKMALIAVVGFLVTSSFFFTKSISGYLSKDEFLLYRETSTSDLGVPLDKWLYSSLVLLIPILFLINFYVKEKRKVEISLLLAGLAAWILLSFNDKWGVNQEPYRFWINIFIILTFIVLPLTLEFMALSYKAKNYSRITLGIIIFGLYGGSSIDSVYFYKANESRGIYYYESPQHVAIKKISRGLSDQLTLLDSCIDPLIYKSISGHPVVFFNAGMAWPENKNNIEVLMQSIKSAEVSLENIEAVGVDSLIIDSSCQVLFDTDVMKQFELAREVSYESGSLVLYQRKAL